MSDLHLRRMTWLLSGPLLVAPSLILLWSICAPFDLRRWWAPAAVALATFAFAGTVEMKWRRAPGTGLLVSMAAGFTVSVLVSLYLPLICCAGPIK